MNTRAKQTVTRRDLEALVAAKGCTLEIRKGGSWPEVLIMAPKGQHFTDGFIHEIVVAGNRGESITPLYKEAWERLFDTDIVACDADCEWWNDEDEPNASPYVFQPYDVLQIKRTATSEWLDFSTLRTADEGVRAQELVRSSRWDGEVVLFRIVRNTPRIGLVVFTEDSQ
jgi:hypothetical protein